MTDEVIEEFFYPYPYQKKTFYNYPLFDFESLKGRVLSSSFIPLEKDEFYKKMINDLSDLYKKYEIDLKVKFEYVSNIYYGIIY